MASGQRRPLAHLAQRCAEDPELGRARRPPRQARRPRPARRHLRRLALSHQPDRARSRAACSAPCQRHPSGASQGWCRRRSSAVDCCRRPPRGHARAAPFKADVALLTALCDLGGVWPVMTAARRLSEAADAAVAAAVRFLFRQAARKRRLAGAGARGLHRAGDGQARRLRAQLLLRHRSHRLLRSGARAPARRPRGAAFLRAPDARSRAPAARAHRARLRVPHRSAPAPRSRLHAARHLHRRGAQLLRERRPELGARRAHQGAPDRGRHRRRAELPRRASRPSSGASTWILRPSPTSTP